MARPDLKKRQSELRINVIDYDLDVMWKAHPLINSLRAKIQSLLPEGLYDPQDLEHQALFRLTTFDPKDITEEIIQRVVEEQYLIVQDRTKKLNYDVEYLFRGLSGKYPDLNIKDRLELCWQNDKLVAKNNFRTFSVEFRVVHDEHIVSLFSNELHYIHQERPRGETFGFYFAGEEIPWAIETTEPSVIAKPYKREALLAHGIDPNKAIELTRFYTLPGAPTNAISLMDGLVAKYYKEKDMEALYTTTMPMYSKTKSTTIAGGINKPLLVKDLRHKFIPEKINGTICYRHVTTVPGDRDETEVILTHPNFPTMLVVEVFRKINESSLPTIDVLQDGKKVIYVKQRDFKKEKEVKFKVNNIYDILERVKGVAKYSRTEHIRDTIMGTGNKGDKKIRLRVMHNFQNAQVEATFKFKIGEKDGIKTEIEDTIYKGDSVKDALKLIKNYGDYGEENSYEKMRSVYETVDVEVVLDVYPFGVWIEIEGESDNIWIMANKLKLKREDSTTKNADELYLDWHKKHNLPEMWDVKFGLTGEK